MKLPERKRRFAIAILLAILPIVLWNILPVSLFLRIAIFFHTDTRLCEDYAFMLAVVPETAAICFFELSRKRPWDWLSACSVVGGLLSGFAIAAFFIAVLAISMQGW